MSNEGEQLTGCALALWQLIVTGPMYLVLVFALMSANEMPNWAWVLYWAYVPCNILGIVFGAIYRAVKELQEPTS